MGIENLKLQDIPKAWVLAKKFNEESPVLNVYKVSSLKGVQTLLNHIVDSNKCAFVAKDGDRMVGIMLGSINEFVFNYEKVLQETLLYVEEDYRNKKIGLELLKSWIKWGKPHNYADIWINITSGMEYTRVGKLLVSMGFKQIGTQWRKRD